MASGEPVIMQMVLASPSIPNLSPCLIESKRLAHQGLKLILRYHCCSPACLLAYSTLPIAILLDQTQDSDRMFQADRYTRAINSFHPIALEKHAQVAKASFVSTFSSTLHPISLNRGYRLPNRLGSYRIMRYNKSPRWRNEIHVCVI